MHRGAAMTEADAYYLLNEIFSLVFYDDNLKLHAGTAAPDINGWDSLACIKILVAVEQALGVEFEQADLANISNVGGLIGLILSKSESTPSNHV